MFEIRFKLDSPCLKRLKRLYDFDQQYVKSKPQTDISVFFKGLIKNLVGGNKKRVDWNIYLFFLIYQNIGSEDPEKKLIKIMG